MTKIQHKDGEWRVSDLSDGPRLPVGFNGVVRLTSRERWPERIVEGEFVVFERRDLRKVVVLGPGPGGLVLFQFGFNGNGRMFYRLGQISDSVDYSDLLDMPPLLICGSSRAYPISVCELPPTEGVFLTVKGVYWGEDSPGRDVTIQAYGPPWALGE